MQLETLCLWAAQSVSRRAVLLYTTQPLTARQFARRTALTLDTCKYTLGQFAKKQLVKCLNAASRASRVIWLTEHGLALQKQFLKNAGLEAPQVTLPQVDWDLYGWLCYRHRSAVLIALGAPLTTSLIKRKIRSQFPNARISVNNVRDVLREFMKRGVAFRVPYLEPKRWVYGLTDQGRDLRELLIRAEARV